MDLSVGSRYKIYAYVDSMDCLNSEEGVFIEYTSEGIPVFKTELMGSVTYNPKLGWKFKKLDS